MECEDSLNLISIFEAQGEVPEHHLPLMASPKSLAQRMQALFDAQELTDVTFHVWDSQEEFCAHRMVLATISPVFRSMLFGDLFDPTKAIPISDVTETAFTTVLRFAYDESIHFKTVDECLQTLFAAHKYLIQPLTGICVSHLRQRVECSNVLSILDCAAFLDLPNLLQPCLHCLDRSIDELLQSGALQAIHSRLWRVILQREPLPCRESALFREFQTWASLNRAELDSREVKGLLSLFHFGHMTVEVLIKEVRPSGLLTLDELLQAVLESSQGSASAARPRRGLDDIPAHLQDSQRTDLVLFYHTSHVSRRCPAAEALFGCLDFRVNAKLLLRGFQLFGPKKAGLSSGLKPDLTANLASRVECLSTRERVVRMVDEKAVLKPCSPLMNTYNYILPSGSAALIYPNEWYRISLNLSSPSYHTTISMCSEPVIRCTDINVTFIFRKPGSWRKASADDKLPYSSFLAGLHYQLLSCGSC